MRNKITTYVITILICISFFPIILLAQNSDDMQFNLSIIFIDRDTTNAVFKSYQNYQKLLAEGKEIKRVYHTEYPERLDVAEITFLSSYVNKSFFHRIKAIRQRHIPETVMMAECFSVSRGRHQTRNRMIAGK